jgi:hypothetical protein
MFLSEIIANPANKPIYVQRRRGLDLNADGTRFEAIQASVGGLTEEAAKVPPRTGQRATV